jgi:hypothetical protein
VQGIFLLGFDRIWIYLIARHDFVLGAVATQDRVFPYYVPNSSIKYSKSDSKDCSQEIL